MQRDSSEYKEPNLLGWVMGTCVAVLAVAYTVKLVYELFDGIFW